MKVIPLVDNYRLDNFNVPIKNGLSLYIETEAYKILFDTGPDDSLVVNAEHLGIDLSQIDMLVISHAHADHGGGLTHFLAINHRAPIFLLEACRGEYFSKDNDGLYKAIGLELSLFTRYQERFHFFNQKLKITQNIMLMQPMVHSTFKPKANARLYCEKDGECIPDDFAHELIMVIKEEQELTLLTGCSHSGIVNMILSVKQEYPDLPIRAVVGGLHLTFLNEKRLAEKRAMVLRIAQSLMQLNIQKIYTGHCTGDEGFAILKDCLNKQIDQLTIGLTLEI